jgi:hypothetical protein
VRAYYKKMLNGVGPVKAKVYNKGYRPLESGEGICADAEERVYIPAGTQVNVLGIYFRGGTPLDKDFLFV